MDKRQSLMASKIAQPINYYYLSYTPNLTHVLTNVRKKCKLGFCETR